LKNQIYPRFRILPYEELAEVLRGDGTAFFEDDPDEPLKRGTVWKAAKKLSRMVGRKVVYKAVTLRLGEDKNGMIDAINGYLFSVED